MRRARRILVVLTVLLVLLLALFSLGLNFFLASPLASQVMNGSPNIAQIHYTKATSPRPFHVALENFELSFQDPNVQLYVSADQVEADIYPWTLLRRRFFATDIKGRGVVFRLRTRTTPGDGTVLDDLPPIPGFEHAERDGSTFPALDKLITVELRKLDVHDLREVWINDLHVEGTFDLDGGFLYKPFQRLQISETHFTRGEGQVTLARKPLATIDLLRLTASLQEIKLGAEASGDATKAMSAELKLEAQLVDIRALNAYLRSVPSVHLDEGAGKLSVAAIIDEGVFRDDSLFTLETSKLVVHLPYFEVVGHSNLRWEVKHQESWLDVHVPQFSLVQRTDGKTVLTGAHFRLRAGGSAELSSLTDARLELSLEDAHAKDLSFLNAFIPEGTGVSIGGGKGTVAGRLAIGANRRGKGALDIEGERLVVHNRAARVTGHARVHGEIAAMNLDSGEMNISGSTLELTDVAVEGAGATSTGFWLKLRADPCLFAPQKDLTWATDLKLDFQNLAPVVAIISANAPLPDIVKPFFDEPNVTAGATLNVHKKSIGLEQLHLDSQRIHAKGELQLVEQPAQKGKTPDLAPFGAVLVKVRGLTVGLELAGALVKPVLFEPDHWYASWKDPHGGPTPEAAK